MLVSREHLGHPSDSRRVLREMIAKLVLCVSFVQVDSDLQRGRNMSIIGEEKISTITLSGKCEA